MHYQQGGGSTQFMFPGGLLYQGKNNWENAFVQGELAFMHLGALFCLNLVVLFFADGVEPFSLTLRSRQFWNILSRLCRAVAPTLGDRDFSQSCDLVWLLFGF
jgi:hypothetical protein